MKIDKSWYKKPSDPSFPTSQAAGGVVVRKENGRILIGLVRDRDSRACMLPKGGVKESESFEEAARREIAEETGLTDLKYITELGEGSRLTFKKTVWKTTHYLLFVTNQTKGIQNLQEGEDNLVFGWFDINNLPSIGWPEQKEIVEKNLERIRSSV